MTVLKSLSYCLVAAVALASTAQGQGRTENYLLTTDVAPTGEQINRLSRQVELNNSGQIALGASLGSDDHAAIVQIDTLTSSFRTIFRRGTPSPDGERQIQSFTVYRQLESGQVVANSILGDSTGMVGFDRGLLIGNGGAPTWLTQTGSTVPGSSAQFAIISNPAGTTSGAVIFDATTTESSLDGIYQVNSGGVSARVLQGDLLPGGALIDATPRFSDVNRAGLLVFHSTDTSGGFGVYTETAGSLLAIAASGQVTVDGNGVYQRFFAREEYAARINESGMTAFSIGVAGTSDGSSYASFVSDGTTGRRVVSDAQMSADGLFRYTDFSVFALNDNGRVGFSSILSDSSGERTAGLFTEFGGVITEIVRNDRVYGGSQLNLNSSSFMMNSSGQVAFSAISDGLAGAIYTGDGREMFAIIRPTDAVFGSTVETSLIPNNFSLNDHGQVAYSVSLADGRQVLQLWTPELHWRETTGGNWNDQGSWTLGLTPASVHDVYIDRDVRIAGPITDTQVRSLQIGGGSGSSTLDLQNLSTLTVENGVRILANGSLSGEGVIIGSLSNMGRIDVKDISVSGLLDNHGVIEGHGYLRGALNNELTGSILARTGQQLSLVGSSLNNRGSIIVSDGGRLSINNDAWSSSGTMLVKNHGQLDLGGSFATSSKETITVENTGTVNLTGTLDNTGSSTTFSGAWHLNGGTIVGGSIDASLLAIHSGYIYDVLVSSDLNIDHPFGFLYMGGASSVTGNIHVGSESLFAVGQDFGLSSGQRLALGNAGLSNNGYVTGAFGKMLYFGMDSVIEGNGWITSKSVGEATKIDGEISPGFSTGLLNLVNDWQFGDTSVTHIELASLSDFDRIDIYGNLLLGGKLDVSLFGGFILLGGMDFQFLTTLNGLRTGCFEGLGQDAFVGHFGSADLFIDYTAGDGDDVRLYSITAVPEPSSLLMTFAAASLSLTWRRRLCRRFHQHQ